MAQTSEGPVRLAVLVSHPIQHFAPWHAEAAKLPDLRLKVFFYADWGLSGLKDPEFGTELKWDIPLLEGYEHEFLPAAEPVDVINDPRLDNPTVGDRLEHFAPDVVQVFGYSHRTTRRAAEWCASSGKPLLLYSDSNLKAQPWWKGWAKQATVGRFYRTVDGALYVGDNNRAYHQYFGMPEERLFPGCLPIDRRRLLDSAGDLQATRKEIRARHQIPNGAFVVLFCGKFAPHKRPMDLLHALPNLGEETWALMVGDGELRRSMEAHVQRSGARKVTFTGFVNQAAIGGYYAAADALLVSSSFDNHPLTVTEAALFGLPIVISDQVGCIGAHDTARPQVNAVVYRCGELGQMAQAIRSLQRDSVLRGQLSAGSRQVAEGQTTEVAARQLGHAVRALRQLGKR